MRKEFVRLGLERLEQRDNPSSGWSFWEDTYVGAFLSGLGEGAVNIATGARDAVVEVVRTGGDLVTVWSNWNNIDPSQLNSRLFQGVIETAGDSAAAASYERQLVLGIATLGVVPLVESGYDAIVTGDSTQFSHQAGGFGVMTLVPSAGVKVLNKLPNVPIRLPMPTAGGVLIGADGTLVAMPSGIAWAEVGVITLAMPTEVSTAISVAAMSMTGPGGSRPGGNAPESADVNEIKNWLRTEAPDWLDPNAIADIKAKIQANDMSVWSQPIEVVEINGSIYVLNGHHRLTAAIEAGYKGKIPVTRVQPPRDFNPADNFGTFGGN